MDLSPGSSWRQLINDEFNQDRYKDFRTWYFKKFKDFELKEFKDKYYECTQYIFIVSCLLFSSTISNATSN